jgi:hypothetical protein
LGLKRSVH